MRIEVQQYPDSGHAVAQVIGPDGKVVIAETGDNCENARSRLLSRLQRMVDFGHEAERLLAEIKDAERTKHDARV